MSDFLSRHDVLNAEDFATAVVEVPEWGGSVRVRSLTADENEEVGFGLLTESGQMDPRKARGLNLKLVLWCTIDERGLQLFEEKDLRKLRLKSARPIERIAERVRQISGLTSEERLLPVACPHCGETTEFDLNALDRQYVERRETEPAKNA